MIILKILMIIWILLLGKYVIRLIIEMIKENK